MRQHNAASIKAEDHVDARNGKIGTMYRQRSPTYKYLSVRPGREGLFSRIRWRASVI